MKRHHDDRGLTDRWDKPTAIHNLYKKFLYFEKFHALERPLVICEGKTDSVYLRCAIKSLSSSFPELIDMKSGAPSYKLNFFNYSETNIEIMQITGGTGNLASFMHYYERDTRAYKCPGKKFPVIIVIDNDSGAKPVFDKILSIGKVKADGSDPFYYVSSNLYVVTLPMPSGSTQVCIEDFFEPAVKSIKLNGKSFNADEKTFNPKLHYGKNAFAEEVIKKIWKSTNFNNFSPLLERIVEAINDYDKKV